MKDIEKFIHLEDIKSKNEIKVPEEGIILTEQVSRDMGIKLGDEIILINSDDIEAKAKVIGISKNYLSNYAYLSPEYYSDIFNEDIEFNEAIGNIKDISKDIEDTLSQYLSIIYEKVAQELLLKHSDQFFPFTKIGRWWEKNEEIDIVCFNPTLNKILFGEVKWTSKPVGIDIYESLKEKSRKVAWGDKNRKEYFCLFSKQGFTEAMIERAKKDKVALFKGEELLEL